MPEENSIINLTDDNFKETIKEADKPVLVDFYADWCGPCKMAAPLIEKLAAQYQDKILTAKLDIDQNQATAVDYGVMSIPTVMLFKSAEDKIEIIASQTGLAAESTYREMIEQAL